MTINNCIQCKHNFNYLGQGKAEYCKAFPKGIPDVYKLYPSSCGEWRSEAGRKRAMRVLGFIPRKHDKVDPRQEGDYVFDPI